MLDEILSRYEHVRQIVLLTDAEESRRDFYQSRKFIEVHDCRESGEMTLGVASFGYHWHLHVDFIVTLS